MDDLSNMKSAQELPPPLSAMGVAKTPDVMSTLDETMSYELYEKRLFNEIDIMGDLERDDRGNISIPVDPKTKSKVSVDRQGRAINTNGYLIDQETGDVIHGTTFARMFRSRDLDEKAMLPMPFLIERFNFNPFEMLGTFFYDDLDDPLSFQKSAKRGEYFDELGRQVTL